MIAGKSHRFELLDGVIYFILLIVGFFTLYPFLNTLAVALNDGIDASRGGIYFLPRKFSLDNFIVILNQQKIYNSFIVTLSRTVIGTVLNTLFTGILAFGLSKPFLKGRKFYLFFCIITMYFSGLIIPQYLLFDALGLTNTFLVYFIPYLVNVYFMIMMMTYYRGIPDAVEESAKMDGAGYFRILFTIIIPLSVPIYAVIALYNAVFQWNQWFDAYLFITDENLIPLQNVLIDVINSTRLSEMEASVSGIAADMMSEQSRITVKSVRAATMIVTIGPIILFYPLIQRYFVKGVMIGSVKG